jgi:hypothetical protein
MNDLPKIAYGTFCWNPRLTRNAVIEVARQDYPPELKTHYLLYQAPFPFHFTHPFEHKIIHINVTGPAWPAAWLYKMKAFTFQSREDYLLLFDEDDLFDIDYTKKALEPLLNSKFEISWNYKMVFVQRTRIWEGMYNSAIGTICGKREYLKETSKELHRILPLGASVKFKDGKRYLTGPADLRYRKLLENLYGEYITMHNGKRYYFRHSGMITKKRNTEEDVDYGWDHLRQKATMEITAQQSEAVDWDFNV